MMRYLCATIYIAKVQQPNQLSIVPCITNFIICCKTNNVKEEKELKRLQQNSVYL